MKRLLILAVALGVACSPTENAGSDATTNQGVRGPGPEASQDMGDMSMGEGVIRISSRQAALAGVRFAIVRDAPLTRTVRAVSTVVPNERGLGVINARVDGWIEELYVTETGRHVNAGEALFELYAPDLVTAQEEFLLARELAGTVGGDELLAAARRRFQLWDI
ncbi:MAG: efflux RND transporter periplasmic adaptor subunit, partial [Gemmatimonadales bacterium]